VKKQVHCEEAGSLRRSRFTVKKQVHCEEECPTWNPIATIIRHDGSMPGFGERRKTLRFSALRVLTGKSWAYLKVLQTAYKQL
jgi:hypothetical protein